MIRWLKHAFAVEPAGPAAATADEARILDRLVSEIARRGLTTPALMMLECSRPLNFVASQFLVFIEPFAALIFNKADYRMLVSFLARRGSIEYICQRLETFAARRGDVAANGPGGDQAAGSR